MTRVFKALQCSSGKCRSGAFGFSGGTRLSICASVCLVSLRARFSDGCRQRSERPIRRVEAPTHGLGVVAVHKGRSVVTRAHSASADSPSEPFDRGVERSHAGNNLLSLSRCPATVRNCDPKSETVGGGTPRRLHSRPNAAIADRWVWKKPGYFHTFVISWSRSSGVANPYLHRSQLLIAAVTIRHHKI